MHSLTRTHTSAHRACYPDVEPLTPDIVAVMLCSLSYLEGALKVGDIALTL